MLDTLKTLYNGRSAQARRFRYGLLAFDSVTILFVIVTSFFPRTRPVEIADTVFGVLILADFTARFLVETKRVRYFTRISTWTDFVAMVSFLAPIAGEGFGFLRILRTLRLFHTYQIAWQMRRDFVFWRSREDVILATVNLLVFLFVMTGVIYATQHSRNPEISNYADALYFTVTTLTTTGFGDITLEGTPGRMLAVTVMIVGITLFLRLAQALIRPLKVHHTCPSCGLNRHESDAVHCKHCGEPLKIETEGA